MERIRKIKDKRILAGIILGLCLIAAFIFWALAGKENRELESLLDLGDRYMEELDYEAAIIVFDKVITLDPKDDRGYMGKAMAQYSMGQYDEAIETIYTGIQIADHIEELEKLLSQFEEEQRSIEEQASAENFNNKKEEAKIVEKGPITLNYESIVRYVDTEDAQIQLEVLEGANMETVYTWECHGDCAVVSQDGLVTCQPQSGYAVIRVFDNEDRFRNYAECQVMVVERGDGLKESDNVRIITSDDLCIPIKVERNDDGAQEELQIDNFLKYVYYSGNVVIPESLEFHGREMPITNVSVQSFRWCNKLETIYLPYSIRSFGQQEEIQNPFLYCTDLEKILVDDKNENFKSVDGVLYSSDGKILFSYPAAKEGTTYTIPKSVEKICVGAFAGCKNLIEIRVEEGNEYFETVDGSLIDKKSQSLIAYPIGKKEDSYTVPEGVREIETGVFYRASLESVECGDSVTNLASSSFQDCANLKIISGMEQVTTIAEWAIRNCDNLEKIGGGEGTGAISFINSKKPIKLLYPEKLTNLKSLDLHIDSIEDLSWMSDMRHLNYLNLKTDNLDNMNLSPLLSLENLFVINMDCTSSISNSTLNEEAIAQIEEIQKAKEYGNIDIFSQFFIE